MAKRKTAAQILRGPGGLPPTLTVQEAADLLHIGAVHTRRLCHDGKIKAVKVGRSWHIDRDALLKEIGILK